MCFTEFSEVACTFCPWAATWQALHQCSLSEQRNVKDQVTDFADLIHSLQLSLTSW